MTNKELAELAYNEFIEQVKQSGLDDLTQQYFIQQFVFVQNKGKELATKLKIDADLISAGVSFMDIKLADCLKNNIPSEHVKRSSEFAKLKLAEWKVDKDTTDLLINCVEAHHGAVLHSSKLSEIVTNIDCYKFLHPTGVFLFLHNLGVRKSSFEESMKFFDFKLDEKWNMVTIKTVKDELEQNYKQFKTMIKEASKT